MELLQQKEKRQQFGDQVKQMTTLHPSLKPKESDAQGLKRKNLDPKQAAIRKRLILEQKCVLPIFSAKEKIVQQVIQNNTLIVIGETGSGKTTQLPQFLHGAGFCKSGKIIGITQPRRVAAVSVASRVAEEMDVQVGKEVGFSIRFEDVTSSITRIKYMTDGMLLREALLDPLLKKYSVVIVDEAHERTIHTDVLFGLLKGIQARRFISIKGASREENGVELNKSKRFHLMTAVENNGSCPKNLPHNKNADTLETNLEKESHNVASGSSMERRLSPLKLVIMSATLDAQGFSDYFGGAKVVYIQGRQFHVEIHYTYTPEADYLDAALTTILQVHVEEAPGDILVFLTGQEEIESMERLLHDRISCFSEGMAKILVVPIFAALPSDQQMKVFKTAPTGFRKVILATNIAETSVTIPGIRYVIDPGLVKARSYNPRTGVEALAIVPISKAQALQRSGRAGREGPGKCFRLYTEETFHKLDDVTVPEIKRCNLASVVLQLKALGIDNVLGFDFMEKPSRMAILKSLEHLYALGALTDEGKLSDPVGMQMARLPLEPLFAKAMLMAVNFKCSEEMLALVAMLSVESIFFTPQDKLKEANVARLQFSSSEGDHITFVNVLRAFVSECKKTGELKTKKAKKNLQIWCNAHFINGRSLKRALNIHRQIQGYVEGIGLELVSCGEDYTCLRRCLAASFFLNAACKQPDGTFRASASGQIVSIHPSSVMFGKKPDCIIFNELVHTNKYYVRNVTRIDPLWLPELAPRFYGIRDVQTNLSPNSAGQKPVQV